MMLVPKGTGSVVLSLVVFLLNLIILFESLTLLGVYYKRLIDLIEILILVAILLVIGIVKLSRLKILKQLLLPTRKSAKDGGNK